MNEFQARMFIEQVLAQPTIPAAAQLLHDNAPALDETFFFVLDQLIQAEQPPSGSWGNSFEDRLAEGMARLRSPSPPNQRLQALQMLQDYAFQLSRQQAAPDPMAAGAPLPPRRTDPATPPDSEPPVLSPAAATPPPGGAARGFDYWIDELKKRGASQPAAESAAESEPLTDLEKAQRLMEIDRRYLPLMAEIMPGRANARTIAGLEGICADYERLARAGPPAYPFFTPQDLRGKIADVLESIARSHDSLNHAAEAGEHYRRASEAWTDAGKSDNARRCDTALARLKLSTEAGVDDEFQRLQASLSATPPNTLAHVQALVELAELQSGNGDDFAAEELLLQAREELTRLGNTASGPSGSDLAGALEETMRSILSGEPRTGPTPIETQIQVRGLQRRLLLALAQVCRDSDPARAAEYLQQSKQMDSAGENREFSDRMLASLNTLFGGPPQPPRIR